MSDYIAPLSSVNVTVNGEAREIFMSFNRLNRLTYLVGGVDHLQAVMMNPEMRSAVIRDLVQKRDEKGVIIRDYTEEELELSQEDALNLLDFAQEHIMDFFVKAAEKSNRLISNSKPRIDALNSTPTPTGQGS